MPNSDIGSKKSDKAKFHYIRSRVHSLFSNYYLCRKENEMKIHFIAIGGAVMHNLAIALHKKNIEVSGSDDEIFEPSKSRLLKYGLLPESRGWHPEKINKEIDAVIVGMHAKEDNPELQKAKELKLKIYSFPEYLYKQTKNKKRIVIAGSHGKTTITSMIMHVLKKNGYKFDYMVGSRIEGFETMVGLSEDTDLAIFEGDEYLSSALDNRPKFLHYKPDIALLSGIAWDHMNVFPEYENYLEQFKILTRNMSKKAVLIYNQNDPECVKVSELAPRGIKRISYSLPPFKVGEDITIVKVRGKEYKTSLFGKYNIENISAALNVCRLIGITGNEFFKSLEDFRGAARRQELIFENDKQKIYYDFAHAPSKVRATAAAFREKFPGQKLIIFLELHTFSSLNRNFLPQYKNSLENTDEGTVFYDPEVVKHKKLPPLEKEFVKDAFHQKNLNIVTDKAELEKLLSAKMKEENSVILIMSSGNLGGINLKEQIEKRTKD